MATVISFISRKGGTGKTTHARHRATTLHHLGKRVLVVETDTNYTLSTLRGMELGGAKDKEVPFEIVGSKDQDVAGELSGIRTTNKYDYLIVDCAGKTTDEGIRKLSLISDAVIIPTSLTQNDLLVTYQTVTDLSPARDLNPSLRIMVLPNRIHSATGLFTVRENLRHLDAHVLPVIVPQKNLFVHFSTLTPEKDYLPVAEEILKNLA